MSLATEVTNRFTSQELVELTNPNGTGTTVNTTYLGYATADVEAEFANSGITFDATNAQHIAVAVDGVRARLRSYSNTGGVGAADQAVWEGWIEKRLERLAGATSHARVSPRTSTQTTPSSELPDGVTTVRPWSDSSRFSDYQVGAPGPTDPNDSDDS